MHAAEDVPKFRPEAEERRAEGKRCGGIASGEKRAGVTKPPETFREPSPKSNRRSESVERAAELSTTLREWKVPQIFENRGLTSADRLARLSRVAKQAELSSEELRRSVSETLKRVAYTGQTYIVTLYGKPVAKIVPLDEDDTKEPKRARPRD